MFDGRVDVEPLGGGLFAGDNEVDVVAASQKVVSDGQQSIGVWGKIDANDFGLFVDHMIDEARVLMAEPVVVLPPHMRTEQVVQRSDGPPPANMTRDLEPLGVLIEHRIHNVNEGLVTVEKTVAASEQVTLQPAFA